MVVCVCTMYRECAFALMTVTMSELNVDNFMRAKSFTDVLTMTPCLFHIYLHVSDASWEGAVLHGRGALSSPAGGRHLLDAAGWG